MKDISVIIVSYNVRHFLEQCLNSVFRALDGIEGEILVVDNNSADGSCSMVKSRFPAVKLIENASNLGFSAANNQAIKLATGEFILLLNPDTIVPEEAFRICIEFMHKNPDAGAVGLRMVDGRGRYLPESKRGLPTPLTAFFRISGLFSLFPKSAYFNRYYLGNLDPGAIHEVDILTGAFMFIRGTVLEKSGGLDESYFMYGEDIDLSLSIREAGYKNYYLPEPSLIHFKGESSRKSDISRVIHFYKSMIIFARKHFTKRSGKLLILLIRLAVVARGILSLLSTALKRSIMPISEGIIFYLMAILTVRFWEFWKFHNPDYYPELFTAYILPFYSAIWVFGLAVWGAYRKSSGIWSLIKGVLTGTLLILVVYALLPPDLRFSRAIILIGSASVFITSYALRLVLSLKGKTEFPGGIGKEKKVVIAAGEKEYIIILGLLEKSGARCIPLGRVSPFETDSGTYLGKIGNIREVVRVNKPDEIIFSSKDISAARIIESTMLLSDLKIEKKIAQTESHFVIGSKSPSRIGEVYTLKLTEKKL